MTGLAGVRSGQRCNVAERFIDWHESVTGVDEVGIGNASSTEVPIRAVKALVANTKNGLCTVSDQFKEGVERAYLVTTITDSIVANVAARGKKRLCHQSKSSTLNSRLECMLWIVAVLHANVARDAEIKVGTGGAGDEILLGEFWK